MPTSYHVLALTESGMQQTPRPMELILFAPPPAQYLKKGQRTHSKKLLRLSPAIAEEWKGGKIGQLFILDSNDIKYV